MHTDTITAAAFALMLAAIGLTIALAGAETLAEPPCDPTATDDRACTYGDDD